VTPASCSVRVEKFMGYSEATPLISAGIGDDRDRKAEDKETEQIDRGAH